MRKKKMLTPKKRAEGREIRIADRLGDWKM
jgi:hypothetical protein